MDYHKAANERRGARRTTPMPIASLLAQSVERAGVGQQVIAVRLLNACQKLINQKAAPALARHCHAKAYRHGQVLIYTDSHFAAQELLPHISTIQEALIKEFPHAIIDRVAVRAGRQ